MSADATPLEADDASVSPRRFGIWALLSLLIALAAVFVLPGVLGYGVIDDAYISLRYADNFVQGNGLVFNPGEYVEGYTNFLWTLVLGLGIRLGAAGPGFAVWAGLFAAALTLVATLGLHARLARGEGTTGRGLESGWRLAATPLILALSPTFLAYGASGLESAAFAFLLILHAYLILGKQNGIGSNTALGAAGIVLALANMTRPEATAFFVFDVTALVLLWLIQRRKRGSFAVDPRGITLLVTGFALPFGAFLLWRHGTYGYWLPNTYYAKVGGPSSALLGSGGAYMFAVGLRTLALIAVPLGLVAAKMRGDARLLYLSCLLLVQLIVIALVGGDHMALWRFGVTLLPLSVILLREGFETLTQEKLASPIGALLLLLVGWGAGLWTANSVRLHERNEHSRAQLEVTLAEEWASFGQWLARYAESGDSISLLPIGAIGFYSGLHVIDQLGLIDEHIAHLDVETGTGYVGHEKFDNDYVLGLQPRFLMANHQVTFGQEITQTQYDGAAYFEVHRDLVGRPQLRRDYVFRCIRAGDGLHYAFYERRDLTRGEGH
ncbi:MAG: arabinofuranosyltransferase [Planctomycetota bacterium]